jgi:ketosteroid isomerase-like protein
MRIAAVAALVVIVLFGAPAVADTTADPTPEVRKVVDKWLDAQNRGDFAAYEQLYAARFTGVRRSGPRTVKMDRAGWLADRRRMFQKKMEVSIDKLAIAAAPSASRVTFVQTWASGSYKDVGDKQLVVVREGSAWKIAREEMLRSSILASEAKTGAALAQAMLPMFSPTALVVETSAGDELGAGKKTLDDGDPIAVKQNVPMGRLPAEQRALRGRKLFALDENFEICELQVGDPAVVSTFVPHFGMRQEWKEAPKERVIKEAWAQGAKLLVFETSGCKAPTWALPRWKERPAPSVATPADDALKARAVAALRKLPEWAKLQSEWKGYAGAKGRWDEADDATVEVNVVEARANGKPVKLVSVAAKAGTGCGQFEGALWALYAVRGSKLELVNTPGETYFSVGAALDADGDGTSELFPAPGATSSEFGTHQKAMRGKDGRWDEVERLEIPFLDCPC